MKAQSPQIQSRPSQQGLQLFLPTKSGERVIGRIHHGVLFLWRDERKHFFKVFGGYGIDKALLLDTSRFTFTTIQLTITGPDGKKTIHRVPRQRWIELGKTWTDYQGWQPQVVLPLQNITGRTQNAVTPMAELNAHALLQPSLFTLEEGPMT